MCSWWIYPQVFLDERDIAFLTSDGPRHRLNVKVLQ